MQRILLIAGLIFTSAIVLGVAAWMLLFNTASGRNFLVGQVENSLASAIGGNVEISELTGAPPEQMTVRDVRLSDDNGTWLTLKEASIDWSPSALLGRSINIDTLSIDGLVYARAPIDKEKKETSAPGFSIPNSLPNITANTLSLSNIAVIDEATGEKTTLNGSGSINISDQSFIMKFNAHSDNERDKVELNIDVSADQPTAIVDINIASDVNGILAKLIQSKSAIDFQVTSRSPREDFSAIITGTLGDFGTVEAIAKPDPNENLGLSLAGQFGFGEKLHALATQIGNTITFDLTAAATNNSTAITINALESAAGKITANTAWTAQQTSLDHLETNFAIKLSPDFLKDITAYTGNEFMGEILVDRTGSDYALSSMFQGTTAAFTIDEAKTDLKNILAGEFNLRLDANESAPPALRNGLTLTSNADIDLNNITSFENIVAQIDKDQIFKGRASFNINDQSITANGDVTATPDFIAALPSDIRANNNLTFNLDIAGALNNFKATISAALPSLTIDAQSYPASTTTMALAGLPTRPAGTIQARTLNNETTFNASVTSPDIGIINIHDLAFLGTGFSLIGMATIDQANTGLNIDLTYNGEPGAVPFPGFPLSGTASAKGSLQTNRDDNNLAIIANNIQTDQLALTNVTVTAIGPSSALKIKAFADAIAITDRETISSLAIAGTANTQTTSLSLTTLDLDYGAMPIRLLETASLSAADGFDIQNFNLSIGDNGALLLDGALTTDSIVAKINAKNIPVQQMPASASLTLDVNTNRSTLAEGVVSLIANTAEEKAQPLQARLNWTGNQLIILNEAANDPLKIDLTLPLELIRAPSFSVSATGPIAGTIVYDGPSEAIVPLLPEQFSSFEGALKINSTLSGSTAEPEFDGKLSIAGGAYTDITSGFSVDNIDFVVDAVVQDGKTSANFNGDARGAGQDKQTLSLNGDVIFGEEGKLNATIKLNEAQFAAEPVTNIDVSGEVVVAGPLDALEAVGEITISELNAEIVTPASSGLVNIDVVAVDQTNADSPLEKTESKPSSFKYDLKINADDKLFVRGRGLESEWTANLTTESNESGALVLGEINLRRGYLDFSGRRFDLTQGQMVFNRLTPNNPFLDIRAEYETSDEVVAAIVIKGRALEPSVELESTPTLPQEDIMALVLFGKPANELTALESVQIAQALAQLGGIGPFAGSGLAGSARDALGLDLLNLDLDPESGASALTVGKYVTDGLFVSATQDVKGENSAVNVEYEITNNITVETELRQDGDQTVSANWKRDF